MNETEVLYRDWGVGDVQPDGFVNPGTVSYATGEEGAYRRAAMQGRSVVTRLSTDWQPAPVVPGGASQEETPAPVGGEPE